LATFFVGVSGVVTIAVLFFALMVVSKVTDRKFKSKKKESSVRSAWQILANAAVSLLVALVYYLTKDAVCLYVLYAVLAEAFADSMASDIGRLSARQPIDILRFKRIETGLSGGVSCLGLASAVLGSTFAVAVPWIFARFTWKIYLLIVLASFVGVLIDSLLGSGMQALYRCVVCFEKTEKKEHCNVAAQRIKGLSFINNSAVNFLSNLCTAGIAFLLFWWIL
jgi:uncharacterized protein (TIGR00297 family)